MHFGIRKTEGYISDLIVHRNLRYNIRESLNVNIPSRPNNTKYGKKSLRYSVSHL